MKRLRSKEHDDLCKMILFALRHDNQLTRQQFINITANKELLGESQKYGIFHSVATGVYELDLDTVKRVCYMVPDELWNNLADKKFVAEMRTKMDGKKHRVMSDEARAKKHERMMAERRANRRPVVPDTDPLSLANILIPEKLVKVKNNKGVDLVK